MALAYSCFHTKLPGRAAGGGPPCGRAAATGAGVGAGVGRAATGLGFFGVAPLGASDGDGSYFPVNHTEYVQIPGSKLAVTDGQYDIRITEELSEVSYLDQVQLYAIDHPSGGFGRE